MRISTQRVRTGVIVGGVFGVLAACGARGQDAPAPPAPQPGAAPAPAQEPGSGGVLKPVGPERFAREPRTPLEFWDAADYLVRSGQPKLAVPYIEAFLKSNPDDAALLAVREQFGVGSILRLAEDPTTASYAQPVLERLQAAVGRVASNPERLEGAIALLFRGGAEQTLGLERLREAGPAAVPVILGRLSDTGLDARQRAVLAESLGKLDTNAVPPLIAALDAPDAGISTTAARALGHLRDNRALPALMYREARPNEQAAVRGAAREAIALITGRSFEGQPTTALQLLTQQAWRFHRHEVGFPAERVLTWTWLDGAVAPVTLDRADAESELGLLRGRQALEIDPRSLPAQTAYLSLLLERAARRHGVAEVVGQDPDGSFATALSTGPTVLGEVLTRAIEDRHGALAEVAVAALGRVADRDALGQGGAKNPLVAALAAPDRRVQLAAAAALVELDPRGSFPGSSQVVPVLARFLSSHNERRALVVDGNQVRGSATAGVLNGLGYDTETTPNGRVGFQYAAHTAGVELILVDPTALQGGWAWNDLLSNLRADARTADIPVIVTGSLALGDKLRPAVGRYAMTEAMVTPTDPEPFKPALERVLARMGARPVSSEERGKQAKLASELLARIAAKPNSPFAADLAAVEPALSVALANPASSAGAASALGDVPGTAAQQSLATRLLDASQEVSARVAAGTQLVRSIQRFGPLLTDNQEQRLIETMQANMEEGLRPIFAAVVGALRPEPDASGRRLTGAGGDRGATNAPEGSKP